MTDPAIERLVRLETKLDEFIARFDRHEAYRDSQHSDHEGRIRTLEQWRWKVSGIAAMAGSVAGGAVYAVVRALGG